MFRVSRTDEKSCTIITIDGQLSGESIQLVETCCDQAIARGKPVQLVLRDVSFIDRTARTLLRHIVSKGVHLLAHGVYTAHLARELSQAGGAARISPVVNRDPNGLATRRE